MATLTTKDGTRLFYKDWGPRDAQPIVFHHGWPLSADDWDNQMLFFLSEGYRVVAHDRRGHGRSAQTDSGHDMDHYAADASAVAEHLDNAAQLVRSCLATARDVLVQRGRTERSAHRHPRHRYPGARRSLQ